MTYQSADCLDPPMVKILEDDQWWDGVVQAQKLRDDVWWVNVVYHRDGNRVGRFPADHVRPYETDYSRGRRSSEPAGGASPDLTPVEAEQAHFSHHQTPTPVGVSN